MVYVTGLVGPLTRRRAMIVCQLCAELPVDDRSDISPLVKCTVDNGLRRPTMMGIV